MIVHNFICDECGWKTTDTTTMIVHVCEKCGTDMRWDTHVNGTKRGDYEHISESLAISPSQIKEHHEIFPDIDVLPDGRPRFTSVRQQERYLDKTGFQKLRQKSRSLGRKRICP